MGAYIARINSMKESGGDSSARSGSAINSGNDFSGSEQVSSFFQSGGEGMGSTIGSSNSQPLGFLNHGGLMNLGNYSIDNLANFVEGGAFGQNPLKSADGSLSPFGVNTGPALGDASFVGNVSLSEATSLSNNLNAKLPKLVSGGQGQEH